MSSSPRGRETGSSYTQRHRQGADTAPASALQSWRDASPGRARGPSQTALPAGRGGGCWNRRSSRPPSCPAWLGVRDSFASRETTLFSSCSCQSLPSPPLQLNIYSGLEGWRRPHPPLEPTLLGTQLLTSSPRGAEGRSTHQQLPLAVQPAPSSAWSQGGALQPAVGPGVSRGAGRPWAEPSGRTGLALALPYRSQAVRCSRCPWQLQEGRLRSRMRTAASAQTPQACSSRSPHSLRPGAPPLTAPCPGSTGTPCAALDCLPAPHS